MSMDQRAGDVPPAKRRRDEGDAYDDPYADDRRGRHGRSRSPVGRDIGSNRTDVSGGRLASPPKRRRRDGPDDTGAGGIIEDEDEDDREHEYRREGRGAHRFDRERQGSADYARGSRRSLDRGGDPRARGTPVGSSALGTSSRGEDPYYRSSSSSSSGRYHPYDSGDRDYDRESPRRGERSGRRSYGSDYDPHGPPPHHHYDYDRSPPYRGRRDERHSRSPPYRESGRDMFGRDWPPPGRERESFGGPSHMRTSPPSSHSRRSFPPSDRRGRSTEYGRSPPSYRGERDPRDRDWGNREDPYLDRRSSHEDDLYTQPLRSYKHWLELQDDGISPQEAARKYEEYKNEYMKKLSHNFFTSHKEEDWFKEKYHPEVLEKKKQEIAALAQRNYAGFAAEYEEGNIDVNGVETDLYYSEQASRKQKENQTRRRDKRSSEEGGAGEEEGSKHEESGPDGNGHDSPDAADAEKYDVVLDHLLDAKKLNATSQKEVEPPRNPNSLYIKYIPVKGSKEELQVFLEQVEGFVKLIISEPKKFQNFQRVGWVIYESQDACRAALSKFNGYKLKDYDLQLGPNKVTANGAEIRDRVRIVPPAADEDERVKKDAKTSGQIVRILDKEHEVDSVGLFGSSGESDEDASMAAARAQLNRNITYLRRVHLFCFYCGEQFDSEEEMRRMCGDKPHLRAKRRANHEASAEEDVYTARREMERELENFFESKIRQEDENKFRCTIPKCGKLFMSPEFVKKHLRLKHQDPINQIKEKVVDEQYFQNYLTDPRRILPSMPEAKLPSRPERGDRDRRGMDGDRYGGPYDPYGGPGVVGDKPAFMGRIPPPISIGAPMHRGPPFYSPRVAVPGVGPYAPPIYPPFARPPGPPVYRGRGGFPGGRGGRFSGLNVHRPGYVDLDAPPEDGSLGEQRTAIDYGDLDTVPEPPPSIAIDTSTSSAVTTSVSGSSSSAASSSAAPATAPSSDSTTETPADPEATV